MDYWYRKGGCIAISLAKPGQRTVAAIDISKKAHWNWQDKNAKGKLMSSVEFIEADILAKLDFKEKKFDCNCI